jgi:hypothetical protein
LPAALAACSDGDPKASPPPRASTPRGPAAKPFPELPCKSSEPRTERDGKTLACIVGTDTKVGPITCAADKLVALYGNGKLQECTLKRAHAYNGVPCKAGATAKWFKSAKLYQCSVQKPFAVSGVSCNGRLIFHENGKLHRCELAENAKVGEIEIPAKSQAAFDDSGKPTSVKRPAEAPLAFDTYECAEVDYYRSGTVKTCTTSRDATVAGAKAPTGSLICFDDAGKPSTTAVVGCFGSEPPVTKRK